MLCLVRYLFVISTSVIDCLGRFVSGMTYYVLSETLNLTKLLNLGLAWFDRSNFQFSSRKFFAYVNVSDDSLSVVSYHLEPI